MKTIFYILILSVLTIHANSQTAIKKITFENFFQDTTYYEDLITGELIRHVPPNNSKLKKYFGEKIYKMSQVNKPAVNDNFKKEMISKIESIIDSLKELYSKSRYTKEEISKLFKKGYCTFQFGNVLIDRHGNFLSYELNLPDEYPFNVKQVPPAQWEIRKFEVHMTKLLSSIITRQINSSSKWIPARNKAKAVHAYFDKNITISVNIK